MSDINRLSALLLAVAALAVPPSLASAEPVSGGEGGEVHQSYTELMAEDNSAAEARIRSLSTQFEQLPQLSEAPGGVVAARIGLSGAEEYFSTGEMTADTPVVLASPTKWVTAAVILRLVETGELSLDAPLSTYITDLPETHRALTLRQLLAHTAGVGAPATDPEAMLMVGLDPRAEPVTSITPILQMPLIGEPGSGFKYDGRGVQLAGWAAQQATGQSWAQLFAETIADPLEMEGSWYGVPGQPDVPRDQITNPSIAGGLYATPRDLITFLTMLLNRGLTEDGTRVLAPSSIDELRRLQTADTPLREGAGWLPFSGGYSLAGWCLHPVQPSCHHQYLVGEFGTTLTINWSTDSASMVASMARNPVHNMSFALSLTQNVTIDVSDGDAPSPAPVPVAVPSDTPASETEDPAEETPE